MIFYAVFFLTIIDDCFYCCFLLVAHPWKQHTIITQEYVGHLYPRIVAIVHPSMYLSIVLQCKKPSKLANAEEGTCV